MIKKIVNKIRRNYLNKKWKNRDFVIKNVWSNFEKYDKYKDIREAEHQIGRSLNMVKIADEIYRKDIPGDVIEFGTYQGLGLALLRLSFNDKRDFIGIDSFEGLPESSTIWEKGGFNDTTENEVSEWLRKIDKNFILIKSWFSEEKKKKAFQVLVKDICLVHFDADLGSSTTEALSWIEPYLNKGHPIYFLFDDWGCHPDEVPDAFYDWLGKHKDIKAEKLYTTALTRYYRITK